MITREITEEEWKAWTDRVWMRVHHEWGKHKWHSKGAATALFQRAMHTEIEALFRQLDMDFGGIDGLEEGTPEGMVS